MNVTVIITTYNSPEWLEKVLWGYAVQTQPAAEIIIADDGSTDATRDMIERMRRDTGLPLKHIWQRDDGFRKCRILNKAIVASQSPYLVFTDGDCIPRHDFVEVHAVNAQPGFYLSGGYNKLPLETSQAISKDDVYAQRCFDVAWLRQHGMRFRKKHVKLCVSPGQARWLNRLAFTRCRFKGSNGSVWREDAIKVNGFDECMVWGGLDREFGVRLVNAGITPRHVRYSAIVVHLDHPRGYLDRERVNWNRSLRRRVEQQKITVTPCGINELTDPADGQSKPPVGQGMCRAGASSRRRDPAEPRS